MSADFYSRIEDQIVWYDRESNKNKNYYKISKFITITLSAAIPVTAFAATPVVTAVIGALVAVCEGAQYLGQWQTYWTTYRSTSEALKREKYLFAESAGIYDTAENVRKLLVERVEDIIITENSKWIMTQTKDSSSKKEIATDK